MVKLLALFLAPLIISRLVALAFSFGPGRKLSGRLLGEGISPGDVVDLAQKYSRSASEVVLESAVKWRDEGLPLRRAARARRLYWPAIAADASELLLSAGTLVKVISEFLRDREKLQRQ